MKILILTVGQLQTNCYVVIDEKSKEAIIIDPGDDGDFIIRRIQDEGAEPKAIIATHGHFDHVMAAIELKLAYSIPFLIHKGDLPILSRHQQTAKYFLRIAVYPPPPVDQHIKEGDTISFGTYKLTVIETPGHTPGSICLYSKRGHLFSGDTIFAYGGVGRTDLVGGNQKQLFDSIRKKLFTLADNTIVYPGHGETTTIQAEKNFITTE